MGACDATEAHPVCLDEVLITEELARRPSRPRDRAAEADALAGLAQALADDPGAALDRLAEAALELCRADAAGVGILEPGEAGGVFRCRAVAGTIAPRARGTTEGYAGPCGTAVDRGTPLLFDRPARHFASLSGNDPPACEALVVPFRVGGRAAGAVWVVGHSPEREFDAGDARLLEDLARFAAAACRLSPPRATSGAGRDEPERVEEAPRAGEARRSFLRELGDRLRALADPAKIQYQAACLLGEHLGASRVGYAEDRGDGEMMVVTSDPTQSVPGIQGLHRDDHGRALLRELRAGRTVVRSDVAADPTLSDAEKRAYSDQQVGAMAHWPLVKERRLVGVLFLHRREPHAWSADELDLLEAVAERTWAAVERARAEAAMRASEERLRLVVQGAANYAIFTLDPDRVVTSWSPGATAAFGYTAAEIVGCSGDILFTPEDRVAGVPEAEARAALWHGTVTKDRFHLRQDGSRFYASGTMSPMGTGDARGFVMVVRDLTGQRESEAAFRRTRERLQLALSAARMGIWTWDVENDLQTRDASFNHLLGLGPVETRQPFDEFLQRCVHPGDREAVAAVFESAAARGQRLAIEFRVVRPDGEVRWLRDQGDIYGAVQRPPIRMAGVCVDITELRQAEEIARVQTAKIDRLVDANIIGVIFADPERITDANDAFLEMVGYRRADLEAGLLRWRKMTPPEHFAADERALQELRERGACTPFQKEYFRKDGSRVPILLSAATIDPALPVWACFVQDMSQIKEFENELREADRRKDEFLAMLAHELRNPLAPIVNAASVITYVRDDPETLEWAGDVIQRQVQHLTTLVDELLDVSRITQGKISLETAPLDVPAFVQAAVEASRPLIDARRHRLELIMASEPLRVEGDPTRLTQVVTNLLNNAAKYTPEGGNIRLTVGRERDQAVVTIRDDGSGIPGDMLLKVFDLFTQVDRTLDRAQGGLGIGLTLARRLVEMHGGTLEAKSDGPGRGSEFSVRLPLLPQADPAPRANGFYDVAASPEARRRKILVVDDNRDAAETLARFLRLAGHEVELAFDGPSACEAAATLAPDIVLLDIGLPGLNGYEVARRLRGEPSTASATIVAVTGYGQEADLRRSEAAGFDHHLVKPVDLRKLSALITQASPRAASVGPVS